LIVTSNAPLKLIDERVELRPHGGRGQISLDNQ
jgi:hypothetical protein